MRKVKYSKFCTKLKLVLKRLKDNPAIPIAFCDDEGKEQAFLVSPAFYNPELYEIYRKFYSRNSSAAKLIDLKEGCRTETFTSYGVERGERKRQREEDMDKGESDIIRGVLSSDGSESSEGWEKGE